MICIARAHRSAPRTEAKTRQRADEMNVEMSGRNMPVISSSRIKTQPVWGEQNVQ